MDSLEGEIVGILNVSKSITLNEKDVDQHISEVTHILEALKFWTKMLCLIAPKIKDVVSIFTCVVPQISM